MTSPLVILCLMALLPLFQCLPTPPLPTDPGVKIQFTPLALKYLGQRLPEMTKDFSFHTEIATYPVVINVRGYDEVEFTTIPNDSEPQSYVDYVDVEKEESDSHGHTKVVWEDKEFLEGEKIGGLQMVVKNLTYMVNTTGEHEIVVLNSNVSYVVQLFVGQYNGHMRLARVAAVVDASVATIIKDGVKIVDEEQKANKQQKMMECYVRAIVQSFKSMTDKYPHVLSFAGDVILDYRLTEHPKFTDGIEIDLVGKFVHDTEGLYTEKKVCRTMDEFLVMLKLYQFSEEDFKLEGETYHQTMELYNTDKAENTTALRAEVSDEEEAARASQTFVRLTVSDELFNSAVDVLMIKKKMSHIKFDKFMLNFLMTLYNQYVGTTEQLDPTTLPTDAMLYFWMDPVEEGKKFFKYIDGGAIEELRFGVRYGGKTAKFAFSTQFLAMFRGGKIARDIQKIILEKEAEVGFPRFLTAEKLRGFLQDYLRAYDSQMFMPWILKAMTESRFEDGHLTIGMNGPIFFGDFLQ